MGSAVLFGWIINAITLSLGVALLFSKRYSHLRLVQLYAFGSVAVQVVYLLFVTNWYGYLAVNIIGPMLFALAYWEVCRKLEKRTVNWVWPVLFAILTIPLWPIEFVVKTYVPFALVNLFVAFDIGIAWKKKNPFILTWTILSSFALALDVLKLVITSENLVILVLQRFEMLSRGLEDSILLLIVVWQPMLAWLSPKIKMAATANELDPALVAANNSPVSKLPADIINFPGGTRLSANDMDAIQQVSDDMNLLEPLLLSATRMISLSNKPFLNCDDLRDYLDLDDDQIEAFITKYNIKKFHLLEDKDQWVVRRQDVENIPSDGTTSFHTRDKF